MKDQSRFFVVTAFNWCGYQKLAFHLVLVIFVGT